MTPRRHGVRWTPAHCLRTLLHCLTVFGALYVGPLAHQYATPAPAQRLPARAAGTRAGPPPAHPERLRADIPLSEEERRHAREVWPARSSARARLAAWRSPGAGRRRTDGRRG
ncbi:DUF6059 family protein [Streptomyces sp. NPDC002740]|uniref:Uncharacterized protein n=1 Tax=Streptomyces asoensis TaxID=249586 RepID=A0A6M4X472_9ACTN|nr:DUF6059 family protein [Streptomyces asoensis]QJS99004.1 hypothetical protein G9272_00495 [Streptomyces asoensis]QJT06465.1 hypothetical protein G9272_44400 [Streptomyces asoensis]